MTPFLSRPKIRAALAWALSVTSGCAVEPDQLLYVVGRTVDARGPALEALPLRVTREVAAQSPEPLTDGASVGTPAELARDVSRTDGAFLFELMLYQVTDLSQRVRYALRVTATSEEGAESTASFSGSDEDADLNELPLWRSRPEATEQDAALSLRHPPLTVRGELESEPYVGWQALSGGRPFWEEPFVVTGATWPDRLLEDFDEPRVRVALRSRSFPPDGEVDLTDAIPYDMEAYTPSAAVASRTRVPASRGGRCPAVRPDGLCPFTDGALEPVSFAAPGPLAPSTTEVIVELPRPVAARHLILRNMFAAGIYGVEVAGAQSAESPWQLLASRAVELPPRNTFFMDGPSLYLDLPLDGEVGPVSRIRLKINGDGVTPTLAELSIFE